jgi:hypothetical protein
MSYDNDNHDHTPIQLLIPLCQSVEDAGSELVWINAYCLLTLRQLGGSFNLTGAITLGQRYAENLHLTEELAAGLSAESAICGYDLTAIVGRLGRLPTEANDQKPALRLLAGLKSMLIDHDPIDLAISDESQTAVALHLLRSSQGLDEATKVAIEEECLEACLSDEASVTPFGLASYLVGIARAYIGALAEIYFPQKEKQIIAAWAEWERSIQRQMAALSLVLQIGGDPIRIS